MLANIYFAIIIFFGENLIMVIVMSSQDQPKGMHPDVLRDPRKLYRELWLTRYPPQPWKVFIPKLNEHTVELPALLSGLQASIEVCIINIWNYNYIFFCNITNNIISYFILYNILYRRVVRAALRAAIHRSMHY